MQTVKHIQYVHFLKGAIITEPEAAEQDSSNGKAVALLNNNDANKSFKNDISLDDLIAQLNLTSSRVPIFSPDFPEIDQVPLNSLVSFCTKQYKRRKNRISFIWPHTNNSQPSDQTKKLNLRPGSNKGNMV